MARTPPAGGRGPKDAPTRRVIDIEHDGARHQVTVKRIATARRFSLRIRSALQDVVLTMPSRGSFVAAEAFAQRHSAWIVDRLGALTPSVDLVPGCSVPLRGEPHLAVAHAGLRQRAWAEEADDGRRLHVSGRPADFAATIMTFLRQQARSDLTAAVMRHAARAGVTVERLTLRDTRSRWGSCSARGALNFSWRLILAPPHVLDYVAAHEVAHRVHLDHSTAFWAVTRRLVPDLDRAEAWLKQHGASLHRYR